jgi:hypothetical protein
VQWGYVLRLQKPTGLFKAAVTAFSIGACWILGACSMSMLASEDVNEPGMIYFLPKTIVTLKITAYGNRTFRDGVTDTSALDARDIKENIKDIRIASVTPVNIADRSHSYALKHDASTTSLDRLCMASNTQSLQQGLLISVEGAADDKTGEIVVSVARLAGRLIGSGAFAAVGVGTGDVTSYYTALRSITLDIDPLRREDWRQVNEAMRAAFGPIARKYTFNIENIEQLMGDGRVTNSCPLNSVCYRTRSSVRFTLNTPRGPTSGTYVDVINQRITGHIDVSRAFLVEKITRLKFDNGVLNGVIIRKPSEGLALAKLPLTALDAATTSVLAAPANFLGKFSSQPTSGDLTHQVTDTNKIVDLQTQLAAIRNGDVLSPDNPDTTATSAGAFQLQCVGSVKSASAATSTGSTTK